MNLDNAMICLLDRTLVIAHVCVLRMKPLRMKTSINVLPKPTHLLVRGNALLLD